MNYCIIPVSTVCLFDRNQLLSCGVRKVYGAWLVIDAFLPSGNFIKARTPLHCHLYVHHFTHAIAHLCTAGLYCKRPNTKCLSCIDCTWTFLPLGSFCSTHTVHGVPQTLLGILSQLIAFCTMLNHFGPFWTFWISFQSKRRAGKTTW